MKETTANYPSHPQGRGAGVGPDGKRHIRYLDGLRGVAILLVIMIHTSQIVAGLPSAVRNLAFYGVRGVQLFFIVSGLTLTISHRNKPLALADFAARRFFRIAPMFYFGAALYVALGLLTNLRFAPQNPRWGEIVATLTFVHGWSISANNKIVPGGWSIAAEAMFYLLFPILLKLSVHPRRFTLTVLGTYLLAGLVYYGLRKFVPGDPVMVQTFALNFWLCHLPAFAGGCWIAARIGQDRLSPRAAGLIATCSVVGMVIDSQMRGHSNLLVSIVLLSLFVWAVTKARPRFLEGKLLPLIGEISFSLYILHFLIVGLLALIAGPVEQRIGWAATFVLFYLVTLAVAGSLAYASFRWIETPFIALGRNLFRNEPRAG